MICVTSYVSVTNLLLFKYRYNYRAGAYVSAFNYLLLIF